MLIKALSGILEVLPQEGFLLYGEQLLIVYKWISVLHVVQTLGNSELCFYNSG